MDGTTQRLDLRAIDEVGSELCIFAAAMIRNENDLIVPFLHQCNELFDGLLVADIRSTDGTAEIVRAFSSPHLDLRVFEVLRQEKFQGALMNCLSREAFAAGADWVFLLDADEFLDVSSRKALEDYLTGVGTDLLMLPWINLVPSKYGSYEKFDESQDFRWSGRVSPFCKVAISSVFATRNPDYVIHEGNHIISPAPGADPIWERPGFPILHVPVRSVDRLRFKINSALRVTKIKHNRAQGEGAHVYELQTVLSQGVDDGALNRIAADYGKPVGRLEALRPEELGWPIKRLPAYVSRNVDGDAPLGVPGRSLSSTLRRDATLIWDKTTFVNGTVVAAAIDGEQIRILPQPIHGDGSFRDPRYRELEQKRAVERPIGEVLIDVASMSGMVPMAWVFSAWSELVPIMFALFTVLRPRRYVELGVHNGMSFFAACQVSERLGLDTECVAIDSWIGDEHAGFHETHVFDAFCNYLRTNYPRQQYIRSLFAAALSCFEDSSIDLLHIDGLHTYEAAKDDFEMWLPKMSSTGVVIFHDINVHDRGFGVWRLWGELKERYPAHGFAHQFGLGIIYVGQEPNDFACLLRDLAGNRQWGSLAQAYFESIGQLVIKHRELEWKVDEEKRLTEVTPIIDNSEDEARIATLSEQLHVATQQLQSAQIEFERAHAQQTELNRLHQTATEQSSAREAALASQLRAVVGQLQAVVDSTTWRATWPLRRLFLHLPGLRSTLRRAAKVFWWTITGQLPRRLRARSGRAPRSPRSTRSVGHA